MVLQISAIFCINIKLFVAPELTKFQTMTAVQEPSYLDYRL